MDGHTEFENGCVEWMPLEAEISQEEKWPLSPALELQGSWTAIRCYKSQTSVS